MKNVTTLTFNGGRTVEAEIQIIGSRSYAYLRGEVARSLRPEELEKFSGSNGWIPIEVTYRQGILVIELEKKR